MSYVSDKVRQQSISSQKAAAAYAADPGCVCNARVCLAPPKIAAAAAGELENVMSVGVGDASATVNRCSSFFPGTLAAQGLSGEQLVLSGQGDGIVGHPGKRHN
jgi:hypothetical protein